MVIFTDRKSASVKDKWKHCDVTVLRKEYKEDIEWQLGLERYIWISVARVLYD